MSTLAQAAPHAHGWSRTVSLLLNIGHGIDHMFLLIFATAVGDGRRRVRLFELGQTSCRTAWAPSRCSASARCPAGRLGDLWGRRIMMIIFFVGIGVAALLTALTQNAWQLAAALTLIGAFAAIYHPVGIPMLVQNARNPGAVIGVNGLAGNLGIAVAALVTGFLVKWIGWRAAFVVPGHPRDRVRHRVRDRVPEGDRSAVEAQGRQGQGRRCRPRCWCARSRS